MRLPFTRKRLVDWAGAEVVERADRLVDEGAVLRADFNQGMIEGAVLNNGRDMATGLRIISPTLVECLCPCHASRERGLVCGHAIAVALALVRRAADPEREARYRAERRRAERLATVDEAAYLRRVPADTPGARPARVVVRLPATWRDDVATGTVQLACAIDMPNRLTPAGQVSRDLKLSFSKADENLLYVLEDIAAGPVGDHVAATAADLINVIDLHRGRSLSVAGGPDVPVGTVALRAHVRMDLDPESGGLRLALHTELPVPEAAPPAPPRYLIGGRTGWVYGRGQLWPLDDLLPGPYHSIYREPIAIAREDVPRFMCREYPELAARLPIETELTPDLLTIEPGNPAWRLVVRGSRASLAATLYACYGPLALVAGAPDPRGDFALPDPDDLLRFEGRHPAAEREALRRLAARGLVGETGDTLTPIVDKRHVMNFLGQHLPALRRQGWRVDLEGSVAGFLDELDFVTPVIHVAQPPNENGWFDVAFDYERPDGASISAADIQRALRMGNAFIECGGRTCLIDADAVERMTSVFDDCGGDAGDRPGHFRVGAIYAPFVKASLDALDGVDIEDTPAWRDRADRANRALRLEPIAPAPPLDTLLRPYQREGVSWLRFLETHGFGGLLADEMGLGKTVQALAWLRLDRVHAAARGCPALVVCPTSLVDNWCEEAARFAPELTVIALSGPDRHALWERARGGDLLVTSYALLRRDIDRYRELPLSVAILDEAQHIKNRGTQNAAAAKAITARHRIVLTGTPMENSVMDLWSIMDFLMPGYLGRADNFKQHYEQPVARGGEEGAAAQARLRRKLHPFMLRRLKREVAAELPPKIERVAACRLSPDQAAVYQELLQRSRRKASAMVAGKGFHASRMEILVLLMRLRQVCCHLDLIALPGLEPAQPSAKLDHCLELLDEAIDGGHRVLIFSQFVKMLRILRRTFDARDIPYSYLDGSTPDRLAVVHRFNADRSIPVFLISLKAGGTGLNLTGADMVIHYDPWWNPAVEAQATDRAYRIGQKRTVYSVKLITSDTVEEKVLALQQKKRAVIDATVERDDAAALTALTWDDVQELLAL